MNGATTISTQTGIPSASITQAAEPNSEGKLCFFFVCLFTAAIYVRPEDIFPAMGHLHLTFALLACAAAACLAGLFSGNTPLIWPRELRFMVLLTLWFAVGVPFAYWRGGSLEVLTQTWLKTFVVFFLLTQSLLALSRIRTVLWIIVLSELAVTAYSILDPTQSRWVGDRMAGINQGILGWNFLGIAFALTVPYIAVLFMVRPSLLKCSLLTAATAAMMWMLVLTASRSGMLTVAFSIVLTWVLVLRDSPWGKVIGVGLVAAAVIAIGVAPGVFWQRMGTIWSDQLPTNSVAASAEQSENERHTILVRSIQYTFEHPIFGLGLGNFGNFSATQVADSTAWEGTHNSFTQLSSEAGIPALMFFLALIFTSIRSMRRLGREEYASPDNEELKKMASATQVSLVSFLFGAFFAHISYECYLYYPVAIAAAVAYIASNAPLAAEKSTRSTPFDFQETIRSAHA